MNKKKVSKHLIGLFETLKTPNEEALSEFRIMAYLKALEPYGDEQIEAAIWKAASVFKFFPKPAELLELIEGSPNDKAWEAWETLLGAISRIGPWKSVRFKDGRIGRVVDVLGGWIKICEWTEDELKWRREEFMSAYKAMRDSPSVVLPGITHLENAMNGYEENIPDPILVDGPPKQLVHGKPIPPALLIEERQETMGIPDQLREGMDGLLSRMSMQSEE